MAMQPVMEDPSEQSQDAPAGGAEGGKFEQLVTSVSANLSKIQQLLSQEGVPEELTSKLGDLNDQYQSILQEIMQSLGGSGGKPGPSKPGTGMVDAQGGVSGVPV